MNEQQALTTLLLVKNAIGRNYKSAIRQAWMTGDYGCLDNWTGDLQQIRNQFGPSWLVNARPVPPNVAAPYVL